MKQNILLTMIAIFLFPILAYSLSADLKKKYPFTLLTDDYGILNEIDLDSELDGVKHPPLFSHRNRVFIYWQCFPRDSIRISLEDLGDSPEDDPESDVKYNGENNAKLSITAISKEKIIHKYTMISNFPTTITEDRFNRYLKLMQGAKNVCIAGSYLEREVKVFDLKKHQVHYWVFEKMKTQNGCDSYHRNGCHY